MGTILDAYMVWIKGQLDVSPAYRSVLVGRFLLMGWAIAPSLSVLYWSLPGNYLLLTGIGGVIYTLGVPVFLSTFEFHLPVWHACVVIAAACMFVANYMYIAGCESFF